jgi:hypothetical protein
MPVTVSDLARKRQLRSCRIGISTWQVGIQALGVPNACSAPGTLTSLDRYLHQRAAGMIASLFRLIRSAAIQAILDGSERVTRGDPGIDRRGRGRGGRPAGRAT